MTWTHEQIETLKRLTAAGRPASEIAKVLRVTPSNVAHKRARLGLRGLAGHKRWTPERTEALKRLKAANYSAAQIAEELGTTKNAVIGKLDRLGLADATRRPRAAEAQRQERKAQAPHYRPSRTRPQCADPTPPPASSTKRLVDLEYTDCCWPIGDPKHPDFRFCAKRRVTGRPYCSDHAAVAVRRD